MKKFYCIIQGQGDFGWIQLIKDIFEAEDKKSARELVRKEFEKDMPMRYKRENVKPDSLLLKLYELNGSYFSKDFFDEKTCRRCGKKFTLCEKFNVVGRFGDYEICSDRCQAEELNDREVQHDNFNFCEPVIYKITQISTGKVYIGKTERSYTLRWWEHIKDKSWIKDDPTDITYQIIEIFKKGEKTDYILERETYWINHYNSIEQGFNCFVSKKEDKEKDQMRLV